MSDRSPFSTFDLEDLLEPDADDLLKRGFRRVFDPDAARCIAERLQADDSTDAQCGGALSWLQKLAGDDHFGYRSPLRSSAKVVDAIEAIAAAAPNFADLVDLFVTRIRGGLFTPASFRPPPILLTGPPGVGKTYVANEIATALGSVFHTVSMVNENSVNPFAGTDRVWRAARIGVVARLLIEGATDAPVVLVDEIDKPARAGGALDSPVDALLALLEPYQAARFRDNLLDVEFAADGVIWIASANDLASVPPPVVDRFTVIHVDPPTPSQALAVLCSIYAGVIARYQGWFDADLPNAVATRLASAHPRAARKLLDEACARAAARGSRQISAQDLDRAIALHHAERSRRMTIGFV